MRILNMIAFFIVLMTTTAYWVLVGFIMNNPELPSDVKGHLIGIGAIGSIFAIGLMMIFYVLSKPEKRSNELH